MNQHIIKVDGMSCGGCAAGVTRALQAVPGVAEVQVDLASKAVSIRFDGEPQPAAWQQAVENAGFDVIS